MADVFRFPDSPPPPRPKNTLVATLFRMVAPSSGRVLACAVYEVETGLELRVSYENDVMRTQLFRGVDRDERLAETADAWHLALLDKGFTEHEP